MLDTGKELARRPNPFLELLGCRLHRFHVLGQAEAVFAPLSDDLQRGVSERAHLVEQLRALVAELVPKCLKSDANIR